MVSDYDVAVEKQAFNSSSVLCYLKAIQDLKAAGMHIV